MSQGSKASRGLVQQRCPRSTAIFFQADRNGSADDVGALICQVRKLVHEAQGVEARR